MPQEKPKKSKKVVSSVEQSIWKRGGQAAAERRKAGAQYSNTKGEKLILARGIPLGQWRNEERARIKKRAERRVSLDNLGRNIRSVSRRKTP